MAPVKGAGKPPDGCFHTSRLIPCSFFGYLILGLRAYNHKFHAMKSGDQSSVP